MWYRRGTSVVSTAFESALFEELGEAGRRMWLLGAAEGAAGNLSIFLRDLAGPPEQLSDRGAVSLPVVAPALANGWLVVSGSGQRLLDIGRQPLSALCILQIEPDGRHARLHAAEGRRPTSELNSHLAVHNDHVGRRDLSRHAVLHAQPPQLTFLSHIERYGDTLALSRRLLRWQPETIMEFPEGVGVLPFELPGSNEQALATADLLRQHRAVIWRRHGIVARADGEIGKAADLVEYAEAAARYEILNLQSGEPSQGLSDADLRAIADRLGLRQWIF